LQVVLHGRADGAEGITMPQENWKNKRLARLALGCMLGAVLIVAGGIASAIAGDDEEEEDNLPDVQLMRSILKGFGLQRGDNTIEYHERSPLVIPPNRDLPPPESAAAAKPNTPNWPVDAEVKRRKVAAAAAKKVSSIDESRALQPFEMQPGGSGADVKGKAQPAPYSDSTTTGAPLSPSQLGFNGWSFNDLFGNKPSSTTFTSEPARATLTEPPVGYRTPSPDQPYAVTSGAKPGDVKAYDYANQHGTE
jgi:hypothetical protein